MGWKKQHRLRKIGRARVSSSSGNGTGCMCIEKEIIAKEKRREGYRVEEGEGGRGRGGGEELVRNRDKSIYSVAVCCLPEIHEIWLFREELN